MWAWLNPANWFKVISFVTSLISMIQQGIAAYQNHQRKKADDKKAADSAAKLKEALAKGDDDEIANRGRDVLNGD